MLAWYSHAMQGYLSDLYLYTYTICLAFDCARLHIHSTVCFRVSSSRSVVVNDMNIWISNRQTHGQRSFFLRHKLDVNFSEIPTINHKLSPSYVKW